MDNISRVIEISYSNIKTRELVKKIALEFESVCKKDFMKTKVFDIVQYYSYLKEKKKLKESTIKNRMSYISSLYSKLLSYELIEANPFVKARTSLPKIKNQYFPDIEKRIEEQDIDKTIKHVAKVVKDKHFACALKVLKYTGLRIFELASAKKENLKKDKYNNYVLSVIGKSNKGRSVFVPNFLVKELDSFANKTDYLLTSKYNTQIDYMHFSQYLLRYSKKAIDKKFSAHKIRSFFATNLLEKGIELNEISKLLGHSSVDITARYYLRTDSNSKEILKHFTKI